MATSFHLRTSDTDRVEAAYRDTMLGVAWLAPAGGGWVSVYDRDSELLPVSELDRYAAAWSRLCGAAALAVRLGAADVTCRAHLEGRLLPQVDALYRTDVTPDQVANVYADEPVVWTDGDEALSRLLQSAMQRVAEDVSLAAVRQDLVALQQACRAWPADAVRAALSAHGVGGVDSVDTVLADRGLLRRAAEARARRGGRPDPVRPAVAPEVRMAGLARLLGLDPLRSLLSFPLIEGERVEPGVWAGFRRVVTT